MRNTTKWKWLLISTGLFPLLGVGCSTTLRDALASGAFDFVASSVTELLERLLPVVDAVAPA